LGVLVYYRSSLILILNIRHVEKNILRNSKDLSTAYALNTIEVVKLYKKLNIFINHIIKYYLLIYINS
jgi:hypothetical protein